MVASDPGDPGDELPAIDETTLSFSGLDVDLEPSDTAGKPRGDTLFSVSGPDAAPIGEAAAEAASAKAAAQRTASGLPHGMRPTAVLHVADPHRYKIASEHARGGMGRILLAVDRAFGREVAIKELLIGDAKGDEGVAPPAGGQGDGHVAPPATPTPDPVVLERFLREARITGRLEHPNIVPVYEIGQRPDGACYYTMKFVRGRTLSSRLTEIANDKTLNPATKLAARLKLLTAFADVCNAVAYAHSKKVVHRDLKPDNIMLGEFGETVILDWGLARMEGEEDTARSTAIATRSDLQAARKAAAAASSSSRLTLEGSILGTPAYMSPEQARGELELVDAKSDVFALGSILYEIVTGQRAYKGESVLDILDAIDAGPPAAVATVCPDAPPELAALIDRAMARERSGRIGSAKLLAGEVEAWRDGKALSTYSYSTGEQLRRIYRKHRAAVLTATAAMLAIVVIGVVAFAGVTAERDAANEAREGQRIAAEAANESAMAASQAREEADDAKALALIRLAETSGSEAAIAEAGQQAVPKRWHQRLAETVRRASQPFRIGLQRALGPGEYGSLAYDPSGALLACGLGNHSIQLFDAKTGVLARSLQGPTDRRGGLDHFHVLCLAFSRDGALLASGTTDYGVVGVWDVASGRLLQSVTPRTPSGLPAQSITSLSFSADAKSLAIGWMDDPESVGLIVRDVQGAKNVWETVEHPTCFGTFAGGGGNTLICLRRDTVALVDLVSGRDLWTYPRGVPMIGRLAVSPDGGSLACVAGNGVRFLSTESGVPIKSASLDVNGVYSLSYSRDGRVLACGADKEVCLLDPATGAVVGNYGFKETGSEQSDAGISRLTMWALSPDGGRVAIAKGGANEVAVWEFNSSWSWRPTMWVSGWHRSAISAVAYSPNGTLLATGAADRMVKLWDPGTGDLKYTLGPASGRPGLWEQDAQGNRLPAWTVGPAGTPTALAFSPNNSLLAVTCGEGQNEFEIWDLHTRTIVMAVRGWSPPGCPPLFRGDDQILQTSGGSEFSFRDIRSGEVARTVKLRRSGSRIHAWAMALGGAELHVAHAWHDPSREASGGGSMRCVSVFDTTTWAEKEELFLAGADPAPRHGDPSQLLVSPDYSLLLSYSENFYDSVRSRRAFLHHAKTGRLVQLVPSTLPGRPALGLSPSNSFFVGAYRGVAGSNSSDTGITAVIWSLNGGQMLRVLGAECEWPANLDRNPVIAFSPDGQSFATGDGSGRVLIWGERPLVLADQK